MRHDPTHGTFTFFETGDTAIPLRKQLWDIILSAANAEIDGDTRSTHNITDKPNQQRPKSTEYGGHCADVFCTSLSLKSDKNTTYSCEVIRSHGLHTAGARPVGGTRPPPGTNRVPAARGYLPAAAGRTMTMIGTSLTRHTSSTSPHAGHVPTPPGSPGRSGRHSVRSQSIRRPVTRAHSRPRWTRDTEGRGNTPVLTRPSPSTVDRSPARHSRPSHPPLTGLAAHSRAVLHAPGRRPRASVRVRPLRRTRPRGRRRPSRPPPARRS